jgi:preprotein translocase subunit SecF
MPDERALREAADQCTCNQIEDVCPQCSKSTLCKAVVYALIVTVLWVAMWLGIGFSVGVVKSLHHIN